MAACCSCIPGGGGGGGGGGVECACRSCARRRLTHLHGCLLQLYLGLASMAAGIDANAGRVLADAETAVQSIAPDAVKPKNMAAKLRDLSTIPRLKSFGSSAAASREPSNTAPSTTSNHRCGMFPTSRGTAYNQITLTILIGAERSAMSKHRGERGGRLGLGWAPPPFICLCKLA